MLNYSKQYDTSHKVIILEKKNEYKSIDTEEKVLDTKRINSCSESFLHFQSFNNITAGPPFSSSTHYGSMSRQA